LKGHQGQLLGALKRKAKSTYTFGHPIGKWRESQSDTYFCIKHPEAQVKANVEVPMSRNKHSLAKGYVASALWPLPFPWARNPLFENEFYRSAVLFEKSIFKTSRGQSKTKLGELCVDSKVIRVGSHTNKLNLCEKI
jgi:hypothetical protein